MNPPANRPSEPLHAPEPPPVPPASPARPPEMELQGTDPAIDAEATDGTRKAPIPEPSHPRQYRAIGLIQGIYEPSEEQITRGTLTTQDGAKIDAVLLGRVISLIKNHLDLSVPHLWVVYPRTRQSNDCLHVQVVGVWEPETLDKDKTEDTESADSASADSSTVHNGYFSIRGEVVYASNDKKAVIVKIRQSPKKESEKPKFFKVKLVGTLPDRPVGHFWDLKAQLQQYNLEIQEANDLGFIKKKPSLRTDKKRPFQKRDNRPGMGDNRPRIGEKPKLEGRAKPKPIVNKPVKPVKNIAPKPEAD